MRIQSSVSELISFVHAYLQQVYDPASTCTEELLASIEISYGYAENMPFLPIKYSFLKNLLSFELPCEKALKLTPPCALSLNI